MRQQINLFNVAIEPARVAVSAKHISYLVGFSMLLSTFYYAQLAQKERTLQQQNQEIQAELARTKTKLKARVVAMRVKNNPDDDDRVNRKERELKEISETVLLLKDTPSTLSKGYSVYFMALADNRINGLWLTKIEIKSAENKVNLAGKAINPALLPQLLGKLQEASAFEGMAFSGFKMHPLKETISGYPSAMGFELTADNQRNINSQNAVAK